MSKRVMPDITGTVGTTAISVVMPPKGGSCAAFFIRNRDPTNNLFWAAYPATATTASAQLVPGAQVYVDAIIDEGAGISVIGSAAGVPYTITPLG